MEKYIGKSVYKGTAIGPVSVLKKKDSLVKRIHIDNTAEELKRLDAAKERTMTQLGQLYEKALQEVGEVNAAIFEVHQMMCTYRLPRYCMAYSMIPCLSSALEV